MEILEFVRLDEIDPLYYESSYYVTRKTKAARRISSFSTLWKIPATPPSPDHHAPREHIVVIRPRENGMTLHTMFYNNEIREVAEYGKRTPAAEPKEAEKKLATQLIESLAANSSRKNTKTNIRKAMQAMIARSRPARK